MAIKEISPSFSVSPQVRPEELPSLAQAGVRGVVNCRPDDEEPGQPRSHEVEQRARELGLAYRHLPVTPGQVQRHQPGEFAAFLREVDGPVIGFCRTGARAEGLWKLAQEREGDGR